jgi:hypothetical protein
MQKGIRNRVVAMEVLKMEVSSVETTSFSKGLCIFMDGVVSSCWLERLPFRYVTSRRDGCSRVDMLAILMQSSYQNA